MTLRGHVNGTHPAPPTPLMHEIAEAICFVERHPHRERAGARAGIRPSCTPSRNVAARAIGAMRARAEYQLAHPVESVPAEDFGSWLAERMAEQRLTQRQLADLAGVDHATVSRILASSRSPLLATARKLEHALGFSAP